ncbi:MAG: TIGR00730 family Rossman fold protein [Chakrabartia sp.]
MTDHKMPKRLFAHAAQDAETAKKTQTTPQTASPSYRLAFQDEDFLLRDDLRPVRFQLELLKPELLLDEAKIASTLVFYGSARIPAPGTPSAHADAEIAQKLEQLSPYYEAARQLARLASKAPRDAQGWRQFVVCSGGGPSIMEAANRGAHDEGAETIGLNIVLPHEQLPNPYVTPDLSFQFHYFALRKMHFLLRARGVVVFPGGFGTLDEMFELLTLIQTGKIKPMPVLLFGRAFWEDIVDFNALVQHGVIAERDLSIFEYVESADEAWAIIRAFYDHQA